MTPAREGAAAHPMMLEFSTIKGEMALLNQRLESSIQGLNSTMQAVQGEFIGIKERLDAVAQHQADFAHHSSGLERLGTALEKLVADNERRWERHERDNKVVADRVTGHSTGIKVSWALFGVIAAVLGALANSQISRVDERMNDHLAIGAQTRAAYEQRFLRNEQDIRLLQQQRSVLKEPQQQ
jgi:hypothetical protein